MCCEVVVSGHSIKWVESARYLGVHSIHSICFAHVRAKFDVAGSTQNCYFQRRRDQNELCQQSSDRQTYRMVQTTAGRGGWSSREDR